MIKTPLFLRCYWKRMKKIQKCPITTTVILIHQMIYACGKLQIKYRVMIKSVYAKP